MVTSDLDSSLSHTVTYFLRANWNLLPSGHLVYRSRRLWLTSIKKARTVPFRIPSKNSIYYKGKKILFVSNSGGHLKLTFLRGTVKTDELISMALDHANARTDRFDDESAKQSRFYVQIITGEEKGMNQKWERNNRANTSTSSPSVGDSPELESPAELLNDSIDKSFKYDSCEWQTSGTHDPFQTLYYPPHVEKYIKQAEQWMSMEKWYTDRDIPWRRGWLLFGGPGTGKTSLSKAVAQRLGIPMYIYNMNTLSDQEFMKEWDDMQSPCMAVFEDFDNVFHGRIPQTEHKLLSFDCVLNTIGGAKSTHGIFLTVTTNDLSKIDPAMGVVWGTEGNKGGISSRPGRIDSVIELGAMEEDGRLKLATRILRDWPEAIAQLVAEGDNCSPVQFQEMCLQYATLRIEKDLFSDTDKSSNTPVISKGVRSRAMAVM